MKWNSASYKELPAFKASSPSGVTHLFGNGPCRWVIVCCTRTYGSHLEVAAILNEIEEWHIHVVGLNFIVVS